MRGKQYPESVRCIREYFLKGKGIKRLTMNSSMTDCYESCILNHLRSGVGLPVFELACNKPQVTKTRDRGGWGVGVGVEKHTQVLKMPSPPTEELHFTSLHASLDRSTLWCHGGCTISQGYPSTSRCLQLCVSEISTSLCLQSP